MEEKMNETVKKTKVRGRNVLAIVLVLVCAAVFAVGSGGLLAIGNTGVSLEEALQKTSYYETSYMESVAEGEVRSAVSAQMGESSLWVEGTYDENQTVDITNLTAGVHSNHKNAATSYVMRDLVTMYNNSVDDELYQLIEDAESLGDYPEIIEELESTFHTTEYYVDNQGYLYAARNDQGTYLEDYLALMPLETGEVDLYAEYGMILYILDGDTPKVCYELPEGSESLEPVGWDEFSSRYMLDISGLTEEEQEDIYYGDYSYAFQYLYKHGQELEILLPSSGETLALYALKNPAEVSLMDSYKQLAEAIEKVGYEVTTKQYENMDNTIDVKAAPLAYYWISDGKTVWTNNPLWTSNDIAAIRDEIQYRESDQELNNEYPMYDAVSFYEDAEDVLDVVTLFSTLDTNRDYVSFEHEIYQSYGITEGWYVIALNPGVTSHQEFLDIDTELWQAWNVYNIHQEYTMLYLLATCIGAAGVIIFGIFSIVWAGRRDKTKDRYAGPFATKVPIEILIMLDVVCWVIYAACLIGFMLDGYWNCMVGVRRSDYVLWDIFIIGFAALALWQILTLVTKGKSKNMRTNSLIGRAGRGVVDGINNGAKTSVFTIKCPIELMLLLFLVIWIVYVVVMDNIYWSVIDYYLGIAEFIFVVIVLAGIAILAYWQIATLVHKGRSKNMTTNSLIKRFGGSIVRAVKNAYRNRKVTGKLVICSVIFCVINLIFIGLAVATYAPGFFIFLLVVIWIVTIGLLMKKCMQKQRLKEGIREISSGNLEYQIEMDKMTGDELDMARDLNNLKDGMETAVERMMKSERMKTDLITNVSHDLKTPLTSIINYVDILKKEDIQDEKIRGYINILEQKSLRLKNLTEDLMEAAKISSGNITLDIQNINLKELLYQTNAEFEEKFTRRNLSLVCTLPESDVYIKADGRRMWRVIENLYNNAAKYAQSYSRVYVDGKLQAGKVILIIKNVSEAPLNISADELMERFVRGDVARNTEGSGLGLEIARNLTVMQNGTFEIQLDGDLFKVILTFNAV